MKRLGFLYSATLIVYYSASACTAKYREWKKQSEHANNKACKKVVLLFGFADFCLMYAANNHKLL